MYRDTAAIRMLIRSARCEQPAKRQKPKPCETKARCFSQLSLLVVSNRSWKGQNEGNFMQQCVWHETLRFVCPRFSRINAGAWNPQESGRKAPLSGNAAFSMLQCSFSLVAAQLFGSLENKHFWHRVMWSFCSQNFGSKLQRVFTSDDGCWLLSLVAH